MKDIKMTYRDFEVMCAGILKRTYPEPEFSIEFRRLVNTPTRRFIPDIVIRRISGEVYVADCKYYQPGKRRVDKNTVKDLETYRSLMDADHAFILASEGADITQRAIVYAKGFPVSIIRVRESDTNIHLEI